MSTAYIQSWKKSVPPLKVSFFLCEIYLLTVLQSFLEFFCMIYLFIIFLILQNSPTVKSGRDTAKTTERLGILLWERRTIKERDWGILICIVFYNVGLRISGKCFKCVSKQSREGVWSHGRPTGLKKYFPQWVSAYIVSQDLDRCSYPPPYLRICICHRTYVS